MTVCLLVVAVAFFLRVLNIKEQLWLSLFFKSSISLSLDLNVSLILKKCIYRMPCKEILVFITHWASYQLSELWYVHVSQYDCIGLDFGIYVQRPTSFLLLRPWLLPSHWVWELFRGLSCQRYEFLAKFLSPSLWMVLKCHPCIW